MSDMTPEQALELAHRIQANNPGDPDYPSEEEIAEGLAYMRRNRTESPRQKKKKPIDIDAEVK